MNRVDYSPNFAQTAPEIANVSKDETKRIFESPLKVYVSFVYVFYNQRTLAAPATYATVGIVR